MDVNNFLEEKENKNILMGYFQERNAAVSDDVVNAVLNKKDTIIDDSEQILIKMIQNKAHRNIILNYIKVEKQFNNLENKEKVNDFLSSIKYYIDGYQTFNEYKHLMKNENIKLENYIQEKDFKKRGVFASVINRENIKKFENFNDDVQKAIIKNNANKLKKRIISKKNEHLCDNETNELFLEMSQMDFTKEELQDNIGKKINAFRHPIELNGALMNLIDIKKGWSLELYTEKLKNSNLVENIDYEIRSNKDNQLMIEIKTFEASSLLGSKMWCITRESRMFDAYKESSISNKNYNDYLFIYNFDKKASDDYAMVAALTDVAGNINSIYSKSDIEFSKTDEVVYFEKYLNDKKPNLSDVEMLRKLTDHKIKYNKKEANDYFYSYYDEPKNTEDNKFLDFKDNDDLSFLFYNLPDYNKAFNIEELSSSDFIKNIPEENKSFKLLELEEFQDFIEYEIDDNSNDFFAGLSKKDANALLEEEKFINQIVKNGAVGLVVHKFIEKENYEGIEKIITSDYYKEKSKGLYNEFMNPASHEPMFFLLNNEKYNEYIKKENKLEMLKSVIDNASNDPKVLINSFFLQTNATNVIREMYPETEGYKVDFNEFDYTKNTYLKRLLIADKGMLDTADFSSVRGELKPILEEYLSTPTENQYSFVKKINEDEEVVLNNFDKLINEIEKDNVYEMSDNKISVALREFNLNKLSNAINEKDKLKLDTADFNEYIRYKCIEKMIEKSSSQIDITHLLINQLGKTIECYRKNMKIDKLEGDELLIKMLKDEKYTIDLKFLNKKINKMGNTELYTYHNETEIRKVDNLSDLIKDYPHIEKVIKAIEDRKVEFETPRNERMALKRDENKALNELMQLLNPNNSLNDNEDLSLSTKNDKKKTNRQKL